MKATHRLFYHTQAFLTHSYSVYTAWMEGADSVDFGYSALIYFFIFTLIWIFHFSQIAHLK